MIDIRQTSQYGKYLRKRGWNVVQINHVNCFVKKIPLFGSIIKIQRPEIIPLKKIETLASKCRALQIIIEPKSKLDAIYLKNNKYRKTKGPFLPSKTLHLDLTKTTDELKRGMKKDARRAILKTDKMLLSEPQLKDLKEFRTAWKNAVNTKRYVPSLSSLTILKKTFNKNAFFFLTKTNSAGAIFLVGDKISYYWQAFSNSEGRKSLAQYKIIWEGILKSKAAGAKILDFEGIYDDRFPNKSWQGFTHFKKSFGGQEIEYPGAFAKMLPSIVFKKWKRQTKS